MKRKENVRRLAIYFGCLLKDKVEFSENFVSKNRIFPFSLQVGLNWVRSFSALFLRSFFSFMQNPE